MVGFMYGLCGAGYKGVQCTIGFRMENDGILLRLSVDHKLIWNSKNKIIFVI